MTSSNLPLLSGYPLAVRAERIDAANWLDDFAGAPAPVSAALGLATYCERDLVMVRSHIPFSHFNMVLTLGCPAAVDSRAFEAIDAFYSQGGGGRHWVLVNDYSQPADLRDQLVARGYAPDGAWDRVVLQGAAADKWAPHAHGCELVTPASAQQWSDFIVHCYGMPAVIGGWLNALVGRRGWTHAIRREGGAAGGKIVMARSLYCDDEGWAWLGIDAPIPGVMAPCFEDDQSVVATLLACAAARGARAFVSDIEVPSARRDSEAYRRWGELGFSAVYRRELYVKSQQG
ncbi:hypothetical protein [Caenimonas koreensis]|uniref:hypothetical protein n=1 Tax=Caenimonas koreensis TaxID=367474 RepID=UPI003782F7CA